jgi:hypothetical protein
MPKPARARIKGGLPVWSHTGAQLARDLQFAAVSRRVPDMRTGTHSRSSVNAALRRNQPSTSAIATELEASAPNPTQLRADVLVNEVTTAPQRL